MLKVLQKAWRERRKGGEAETREGVLLMISPPAVGLGWSKRRERGGWGGGCSGIGNKMSFEILLMGRKKISGGGKCLSVSTIMAANINESLYGNDHICSVCTFMHHC